MARSLRETSVAAICSSGRLEVNDIVSNTQGHRMVEYIQ